MNKELLEIYSDYLISQNHHATATGLAAMLDGEVSHDQVSRFLRSDEYGSKELWEYVSQQCVIMNHPLEGYSYSTTLSRKKIIPMKILLIVGIFHMQNIAM